MDKKICFCMLMLAALMFSGCGKSGSKSVTVSWDANRDKQVNTTGGGYTVYYSRQANFDIADAQEVDVPYASGAAAPTSIKLNLSQDVWYIRVAAYGLVNGSVKTSAPSAAIALNVRG